MKQLWLFASSGAEARIRQRFESGNAREHAKGFRVGRDSIQSGGLLYVEQINPGRLTECRP